METISDSEAMHICMRAVEKWGLDSQLGMIQEEAQELGLAMHKLRHRAGGRQDDIDEKEADVIDELADMHIMLMQAKLIFDDDKIQERINFKLNRLKQRLNND